MTYREACDAVLLALGYATSTNTRLQTLAARAVKAALSAYWTINRGYYADRFEWGYDDTSYTLPITSIAADGLSGVVNVSAFGDYTYVKQAILSDGTNKTIVKKIDESGNVLFLKPAPSSWVGGTVDMYPRYAIRWYTGSSIRTGDQFVVNKAILKNGTSRIRTLDWANWSESYKTSGIPRYWKQDGYSIYTDRPLGAYSVEVSGYRRPLTYDAYPSSSEDLDAPFEVHQAVVDYAVGEFEVRYRDKQSGLLKRQLAYNEMLAQSR